MRAQKVCAGAGAEHSFASCAAGGTPSRWFNGMDCRWPHRLQTCAPAPRDFLRPHPKTDYRLLSRPALTRRPENDSRIIVANPPAPRHEWHPPFHPTMLRNASTPADLPRTPASGAGRFCANGRADLSSCRGRAAGQGIGRVARGDSIPGVAPAFAGCDAPPPRATRSGHPSDPGRDITGNRRLPLRSHSRPRPRRPSR